METVIRETPLSRIEEQLKQGRVAIIAKKDSNNPEIRRFFDEANAYFHSKGYEFIINECDEEYHLSLISKLVQRTQNA